MQAKMMQPYSYDLLCDNFYEVTKLGIAMLVTYTQFRLELRSPLSYHLFFEDFF